MVSCYSLFIEPFAAVGAFPSLSSKNFKPFFMRMAAIVLKFKFTFSGSCNKFSRVFFVGLFISSIRKLSNSVTGCRASIARKFFSVFSKLVGVSSTIISSLCEIILSVFFSPLAFLSSGENRVFPVPFSHPNRLVFFPEMSCLTAVFSFVGSEFLFVSFVVGAATLLVISGMPVFPEIIFLVALVPTFSAFSSVFEAGVRHIDGRLA